MRETMNAMSLEDERDITAVIVRYGTAIDTRDWGLFRSCFTDDFRGDYGQFGNWHSREAFAATMQQMHESVGPTLHRMSNTVIACAADDTRARTYVDAILTPRQADDSHHQAVGYYDDELVRTREGWKIRSRRFTAVRIT